MTIVLQNDWKITIFLKRITTYARLSNKKQLKTSKNNVN